jgi:hypothetical protein
MSRSRDRRSSSRKPRSGRIRPDSQAEIQAANLSSPQFRALWHTASTLSWQQFVDRWERRFRPPRIPITKE